MCADIARLANSQPWRDCLNWFSREKQWINERHVQLCRIPAPTFFEKERAEWMSGQFRELGWRSEIDRAGNVIASFNGQYDGPLVALTAHLDTVLAPRMQDEITVAADGSLHGPGVSDNGAGLTALLAVAATVKSRPGINASGLLLAANVGEEGEGNLSGMRYLCKQSPLAGKIGAFVVLDGPNTDHITCQALASRRFDVLVSGPGGHSWSDYGVGNPIHALSRAITLFSDRTQNDTGSARFSYNFGMIEGGSSINSIPSSAHAKIDIRSESTSKINELSALLTASVERALESENERSTSGKVTAKVKEIGSRPGGQLAENAPLLHLIRAVDAHLGIRARLDCASTDANIPLSLGMPAICIGAGGQGGGAHTPGEWFHPEGREFGLRRVLLTLGCLLEAAVAPLAPAANDR
jgi:acetylornithine deacetylase/succinyl-diaminopimelate desuccinylase-like protein